MQFVTLQVRRGAFVNSYYVPHVLIQNFQQINEV